jgi:serine/threonine protein kinase
LMLSTSGDEAELKLIDFGFCKIFNSLDGMYAILGSPYYVAPEVLKAKAPSTGSKSSGYGPAADMWSIGVITYMILCGQAPFDGETDQARLSAVRRGVFTYPPHANLSVEAESFINGLLTVDPLRRLDANGALQHAWLRSVKSTGKSGWTGCLPAPREASDLLN